jgi:hypothetical protein
MIIILGIKESSSAALCAYGTSEANHSCQLFSQKSLNVCDFYRDSSFAEKAECHSPHDFYCCVKTNTRELI